MDGTVVTVHACCSANGIGVSSACCSANGVGVTSRRYCAKEEPRGKGLYKPSMSASQEGWQQSSVGGAS